MMHAEQVLIAELSRRTELLTKLQQCVQNREAIDAKLAAATSADAGYVHCRASSCVRRALSCSYAHGYGHVAVTSMCVVYVVVNVRD